MTGIDEKGSEARFLAPTCRVSRTNPRSFITPRPADLVILGSLFSHRRPRDDTLEELYIVVCISNWICQKVPVEMVKASQFCYRHKVQKVTLPTPVP